MTGQAKQTELRCEVIPGAGQRQIRTKDDRWKGCRTVRKGKEETKRNSGSEEWQDSERWEGGDEEEEEREDKKNTPPFQVCSLLSAG